MHTEINGVCQYFGKKGHTILSADLSNYPEPSPIHGKIPDIVSKDPDGGKVITEVETCETIGSSHTREQYSAFSRARDPSTQFHVAVPQSCLDNAIAYAGNWGITVDQWWYYSGY